jgi:hypothetical protein
MMMAVDPFSKIYGEISLRYQGVDKSLARPTYLSIFFKSREQVVDRRGQIRRIGRVISQDIGSPG